ncbi:hypothetical protein N9L68_03905, partial [bacterium]|nr:hypothetical protein [bacterium]
NTSPHAGEEISTMMSFAGVHPWSPPGFRSDCDALSFIEIALDISMYSNTFRGAVFPGHRS